MKYKDHLSHSCLQRSTHKLLYETQDWGKDEWAVEHGQERAEVVRQDLHHFAGMAITSGDWKGFKLEPHTGEADLQVIIVSHSRFLHYLSQSYLLPTAG